jgi:hypothetical protein
VAPSPTSFAKALLRGAAHEDLGVALPAARLALRLLWLAARDQPGREAAESAARAVEHAINVVRELR